MANIFQNIATAWSPVARRYKNGHKTPLLNSKVISGAETCFMYLPYYETICLDREQQNISQNSYIYLSFLNFVSTLVFATGTKQCTYVRQEVLLNYGWRNLKTKKLKKHWVLSLTHTHVRCKNGPQKFAEIFLFLTMHYVQYLKKETHAWRSFVKRKATGERSLNSEASRWEYRNSSGLS
jgi:hypothetical protein